MKKILFQRRNALLSGSEFSKLLAVVLFIVVMVFMRLVFPNTFITLVTPVTYVGTALTSFAGDVRALSNDSIALLHERDALRVQNNALVHENLTLAARLDDLHALFASNTGTQKGVVAAVLSRPPESPYDMLIIDAGSTEGISVGMRVFGSGLVPLGEVESVTASSARVVLFSSPRKSLSAWVGKDRVPVTLFGQGGGSFLAEVPKAAGVRAHDTVYLAAGGAAAIAEVRQVEGDAASPSAVLVISSLLNPFNVVWVTLLP